MRTMTLYFATSDIDAAHKALSDKGVKVSEVRGENGNIIGLIT